MRPNFTREMARAAMHTALMPFWGSMPAWAALPWNTARMPYLEGEEVETPPTWPAPSRAYRLRQGNLEMSKFLAPCIPCSSQMVKR